MEIKNLQQTSLDDIVQCITESFADYFVQLPSDLSYWEKRFRTARVDYALSYGMFDQGKLTGFIINGIDDLQGRRTAYNTGTGVTTAARGNRIIDQLYQHAIPYFREAGITQCTLEVIQENERALHVYERIGFNIHRRLKCYKGHLPQDNTAATGNKVAFESIADLARQFDVFYSWDFTTAAIRAAGDQFRCYEALDAVQQRFGYFVINPANNQLIQFETMPGKEDQLRSLLSGIATVCPDVRINNVDGERTAVIDALREAALDNFIDQYEMQMAI